MPDEDIINAYNGAKIEAVGSEFTGTTISSKPAYLTYAKNWQFPVSHLTGSVFQNFITFNQTDAIDNQTNTSDYPAVSTITQHVLRLGWQAHESNLTTRYWVTIRNLIDPDHPVALECDQCQSLTEEYYDHPLIHNENCYFYDIRVSALECPSNALRQSNFSSVTITSQQQITDVRADLFESTIMVTWKPIDNRSFSIDVMDLATSTVTERAECKECPPYQLSSPNWQPCQQPLEITVTPLLCNSLAFAQKAELHVHADCLSSATRSSYNKLLFLVTATVLSVVSRWH